MYNQEEYAFLFMSEFEAIVNFYSNKIPKEVYDALISNSMTFLNNFKPQSIQFYCLLVKYLSDIQANVELFEKLIDLVNTKSIYQWFPLLCFVGMQLPWEYAKSIQSISIKKIASLSDWFFWPVIWALELQKDGQVSLMNLLAKDPNNWLHICALIEKCSQVKGQNQDDAINCFLSQVCHYLIISELLLSKPISNYFQLIIGHHLFFRRTTDLNHKCYEFMSETYGKNKDSINSGIPLRPYSSLKKMSSSDIDHLISDESSSSPSEFNSFEIPYNETLKNTSNKVHFGLRLDDSME